MTDSKSKEFQVSVIIPVYNAEKFVVKAVESAVNLREVAEIIVVEDSSLDNSLPICQLLEKKYKKVKLIQHPDKANHGEAASRNIGILMAKMDYVAFLDADDWYLANRFLKDKEIFNKYRRAAAVYSCTILEEDQLDISKRYGAKYDIREKIGFDASPEMFYRAVIKERQILHNTNSITLKKKFLIKEKLFDERLKLHTDTELWDRLKRRGSFFAGEIEKPVAVIRRHENNTITSRSSASALKMIAVFIDNVGVQNLYGFEKVNLFERIIRLKSNSISSNWKRRFYFYSRFLGWSFQKEKFLNNFKKDVLEDKKGTFVISIIKN